MSEILLIVMLLALYDCQSKSKELQQEQLNEEKTHLRQNDL